MTPQRTTMRGKPLVAVAAALRPIGKNVKSAPLSDVAGPPRVKVPRSFTSIAYNLLVF
jgi:hypothetical protein